MKLLVSMLWNYSFIAWKPTRLSYSLIYHSKEQYMIVAGYDSKVDGIVTTKCAVTMLSRSAVTSLLVYNQCVI
ncbi:hypothetical protein [Bacteroides thetaiotaomicron]|uniref:hypothetical protein n=2 Tax=Bacteroides thetaiotaomicron TaxID=818 RepID=UPI001CE34F17|nr:hypothetical protein [Bacteroides thetaiotaomicron]MCA5982992.1 hypothetical protein [Bacteroides thetaiotaomicron]